MLKIEILYYVKNYILLIAILILAICFFIPISSNGQLKWVNVDADFQPLPPNFHVYKTENRFNGKPFIAYYAKAKLKDKEIDFTTDTTFKRRLTPLEFYNKNAKPLLVVNGTFFSFATNQNLNIVIKGGKLLSYNVHSVPLKGKDTFQFKHPLGSAIGIDKKGNADIAWLYTDSASAYAYASQTEMIPLKDSIPTHALDYYLKSSAIDNHLQAVVMKKWHMATAIGGGPVLVQNSQIKVTNNEELKFIGNAINDKHPRTSMGYTKDGWLIIMAIQGRFPGIAEGATLTEESQFLVELGCVEALNLDGGGSSCMLINGKETIKPSDKIGQRPVPAVFIINKK